MENILKAAFAFQKQEANVRLQHIISRVEKSYFSGDAELDEAQLEQVWAAGKIDHARPQKKGNEENG